MSMRWSIRAGGCLVLALTLVMVPSASAIAQVDTPASPSPAATDPSLGLPTALDGIPLAVKHLGPETTEARMMDSNDLLFATLRAVLGDMTDGPTNVTAAAATSEASDFEGHYELTAVRVEGVDADLVLKELFRRLMAEQLRASGEDDPAAAEAMAAKLESLIPWRIVGDREVVSPNVGSDTTFELVYPVDETLYLVRGRDGLSLAEVLSQLPSPTDLAR